LGGEVGLGLWGGAGGYAGGSCEEAEGGTHGGRG
jgi:hypothetical protein